MCVSGNKFYSASGHINIFTVIISDHSKNEANQNKNVTYLHCSKCLPLHLS